MPRTNLFAEEGFLAKKALFVAVAGNGNGPIMRHEHVDDRLIPSPAQLRMHQSFRSTTTRGARTHQLQFDYFILPHMIRALDALFIEWHPLKVSSSVIERFVDTRKARKADTL